MVNRIFDSVKTKNLFHTQRLHRGKLQERLAKLAGGAAIYVIIDGSLFASAQISANVNTIPYLGKIPLPASISSSMSLSDNLKPIARASSRIAAMVPASIVPFLTNASMTPANPMTGMSSVRARLRPFFSSTRTGNPME